MEFILTESRKKGAVVAPADATWLCRLVERLATCAPDDYDFPPYMALVNQIACNAFALGYKQSLLLECSSMLGKPAGRTELLDVTTSCSVCEADFVVRPYVRIKSPSDPETVFCIRKSMLEMSVDGERVLRGPIDEHLIGPDGTPFRKHRWKVGRIQSLFPASFLIGGQADSVWQGIFCTDGSRIKIDVFVPPEFDRAVTLTAGVVAARYTTKGTEGEIPQMNRSSSGP